MKKYILGTLFALCLLISPAFVSPAEAAGLTPVQVSAIISLLQVLGVDQSVIDTIQTSLGGTTIITPSVVITPTHKLPPTGITNYGDETSNSANASVAADTGAFPRQDARYNKPFDYTKIANDGSVLPATATLGTGPKDWACTKDNLTGLIWEVKTTSGLRNKDNTYSWFSSDTTNNGDHNVDPSLGSCSTSGRCDTEKFVVDVNAVQLCGANDWRMSTLKELEGLSDFSRINPAIDSSYFPNTPVSSFWSGTPNSAQGPSTSQYYAWIVDTANGSANYRIRAYPTSVRLVHGTPSPEASAAICQPNRLASNPDSAYSIQNDGTATDSRTGLMWKRCSEGQVWENGTCTGTVSTNTWDQALMLGRNSTFSGYSDWRLPNVKELRSLVEECTEKPTINSTIFPNSTIFSAMPTGIIWSSSPNTQFAGNTDASWAVDFGAGEDMYITRSFTVPARLVRDITTAPISPTSPSASLTVNGQPSITNADPLVSRTWAWSGTPGSTYTASGNITGCDTVSQNGPQSNWKPWTDTKATGNATSGSSSIIPGAVKYGCTIVGTYNVTKNGQTTTSTATITYKHANGTGQNPAILTTHKLPPTGITTYSDATTNTANASVAADTGAFPRQDARYARPFDYTKIANDGSTLPATATLGTRAKDWACTKDNLTGLIWEVKTTSGLRNKDYTYSWYKNGVGTPTGGTCQTTGRCDTEKFTQDVNQTNLCSFTDWRVPRIKELTNIVDFSQFLPTIDPTYFPNTSVALYWSGTINPSTNYHAWYVDFMGGGVTPFSLLYDSRSVRLVRGTISPENQFTITDGGLTVTDSSTGLMWKRDFEMNNPGHPVTWDEAIGGQVSFDWFEWGDALKRAVNDRTAGYSDWRLPNIKELRSIVDETRHNPAIDTDFFPYEFHSTLWSSSQTQDLSPNNQSWWVSLDVGQSQATPREYRSYVRFVRDVKTTDMPVFSPSTIPLNTPTRHTSGTGKGAVISYQDDTCLDKYYNSYLCPANITGYLTFRAIPESNSTFDGWSGECTNTIGFCTISARSENPNRIITAIFNLKEGGNQNTNPNPVTTPVNPHANEVCSDGHTVAWYSQTVHVVVSPFPINPTCADYGVGSPAVSISSLSPSSGPVGTTVTITASGLLGTNSIYLNGSPVDTLNSSGGSTPTWISFVIPSNLPSCPAWDRFCVSGPVLTPGTYTVKVQNTNGTSNSLSLGVN